MFANQCLWTTVPEVLESISLLLFCFAVLTVKVYLWSHQASGPRLNVVMLTWLLIGALACSQHCCVRHDWRIMRNDRHRNVNKALCTSLIAATCKQTQEFFLRKSVLVVGRDRTTTVTCPAKQTSHCTCDDCQPPPPLCGARVAWLGRWGETNGVPINERPSLISFKGRRQQLHITQTLNRTPRTCCSCL